VDEVVIVGGGCGGGGGVAVDCICRGVKRGE